MTDNAFAEFRLYDGTIIGGNNDLELVEAMASKKFVSPRSRASYRRVTAVRAQNLHDVKIDPATDETFIQGLKDAQLLWPVDDDH